MTRDRFLELVREALDHILPPFLRVDDLKMSEDQVFVISMFGKELRMTKYIEPEGEISLSEGSMHVFAYNEALQLVESIRCAYSAVMMDVEALAPVRHKDLFRPED